MTKSLPAEAARAGSPLVTPQPKDRPSRVRIAAVDVASRIVLRSLPKIPKPVKRLLTGGRSITIDGNTLDTTLQLMLAAQRSAGLDGLVASRDVPVARTELRKLAGMVDVDISVGVENVSIPGPAGTMRARHYVPVNTSGTEPLLVFFHGGGFVIGDLDTHDGLCRLICRDAGVHVLSIDYRLAPEHKAPAAGEDCYAAYRWALEHAAELGADPARVAVGGDSAGGNLAAVVSLQARNDGVQLPALQLLIYPVVDFNSETRSKTLFADGFFLTKRDMDWFQAQYLQNAPIDEADPRVAPLLAEDLAGLPPALLLTGGFDPLRDEGNQYAAKLAAAGVPVDHRQYGSLVHGFANFFPLGGGSATAITDMVSAVKAHLSRG
jgi:acetyl esterase